MRGRIAVQKAIAHFYPDSTYAKGLATEIRQRATRQIWRAGDMSALWSPQC
jgi:hypothetical protein